MNAFRKLSLLALVLNAPAFAQEGHTAATNSSASASSARDAYIEKISYNAKHSEQLFSDVRAALAQPNMASLCTSLSELDNAGDSSRGAMQSAGVTSCDSKDAAWTVHDFGRLWGSVFCTKGADGAYLMKADQVKLLRDKVTPALDAAQKANATLKSIR